jgi:hypothetical protein
VAFVPASRHQVLVHVEAERLAERGDRHGDEPGTGKRMNLRYCADAVLAAIGFE